jgi:nitrate reductase gamma subunit
MTLLDFARGPALYWSLIIMVAGIILRLVGALLIARSRPLSKARPGTHAAMGGVRTIFTRSWLPATLGTRVMVQQITGYILHIGLFITILLYIPHIEFIRGLTGLSWPGVPNVVISIAGAVTIAVMIFLLFRRMLNPVLRKISTADDYISWLVTFLPLVTGMMAFAHVGLRYETMLALHILSVELLFIWIPFGKLMHMFNFIPSRAQLGAWFERRGVQA